MKSIPLSEVTPDSNGRLPRGVYRGTFKVSKPSDTFLNFSSWGKGLVYVNGHPLGRIWEIGPQQTLYMPGCWLKQGENEIMVFDIMGPKKAVSEGLKAPLLDNLLVSKPASHREEGQNLNLAGEKPVLTGTFDAGNGWQTRKLETPAKGRYICLEALDAIDGKDVASIAEFYVLDGEGNRLSREPWTVKYADSEDIKKTNRSADKIFDLQESTYWSTVKGVPFPHTVVIDLGKEHEISGIQYLPRMESDVPGAIKNFKLYVSKNGFQY